MTRKHPLHTVLNCKQGSPSKATDGTPKGLVPLEQRSGGREALQNSLSFSELYHSETALPPTGGKPDPKRANKYASLRDIAGIEGTGLFGGEPKAEFTPSQLQP